MAPSPGRKCASVIAVLVQCACASAGVVPDRTSVSEGIRARTGIDSGGLAASGQPSMPPGISLEDGLVLDEAIAIALWNNAGFQAAVADLGIARAELIDARLLRNPILSLLFPLGPKQLEFTLQLPADALWQRRRRIAAATLNAQAVAERLVSEGLRLVADVRVAYVDVAAAEQRLALATENSTLTGRIAGIADARLRAGDISELEARAARSDAARLEAMRTALEHQRMLPRIQLVTLMGLDRDPAQLRVESIDRLPPGECGTLDVLIKDALSARPDVRAAELAIEAGAARVAWERSRIVNLIALLDANGSGRQGFEAGPGVTADLPIFNQNQGGESRGAAEVERASRQYLLVRARVVAEVRTALARLNEAQAAVAIWQQQILPELERERGQAESAYTAGETSLLAVLDVGRRLVDARVTELDARIAFHQAAAALDYSVGRRCGTRSG